MNRRTFISTSIAASVVASRPSWAADAAHHIDRVGLQLYTVREAMKTDFEGTIAKVAATGYKEVEAAKIVGHSYIICPWIDEKQRVESGGWKRAADLFNRAGEASRKAGIQFGYHNHSFEFDPADSLGGKLPYDFLLAETDPKLVKMEMDLCWISVAGKDPLAYFEKYPGRFPLVHVKDWVKDASTPSAYQGAMGQSVKFGGRMADVGRGSINWQNLFAHSGKAGIKHYFVENDDPKSAFDDIKISYDYLHNLQF